MLKNIFDVRKEQSLACETLRAKVLVYEDVAICPYNIRKHTEAPPASYEFNCLIVKATSASKDFLCCKSNFNGSNTDGSFTTAISNSFLSP